MSQAEKLFRALKRGWVSPLECFRITGSLSFSRRRNDVQNENPTIRLESRWKKWKGNRFKEWRVIKLKTNVLPKGICR